jgi:hypothetical protein
MKKLLLQLIIIPTILASGFMVSTFSVHAQETAPVIKTVALDNPLKGGINSIDGLLVAILNVLMVLMVPVIVFFIIYSGFKYVMAQGNASQVEEATRSLTYAVIGGVLILAAIAIAEIIKNVVASFATV